MNPKHIQTALELLSASQLYLGNVYDKMPGLLDEHKVILSAAQAELAELLRIHSLVKGFIEANDIISKDCVEKFVATTWNNEDIAIQLIQDICDIVRYKV